LIAGVHSTYTNVSSTRVCLFVVGLLLGLEGGENRKGFALALALALLVAAAAFEHRLQARDAGRLVLDFGKVPHPHPVVLPPLPLELLEGLALDVGVVPLGRSEGRDGPVVRPHVGPRLDQMLGGWLKARDERSGVVEEGPERLVERVRSRGGGGVDGAGVVRLENVHEGGAATRR
jgi:hypothetical protein